MRSGRIEVVEGGRRRAFGPADAELRATVTVNDPAAWRGPLRGSVGLGEGYVDGLWETDDLVALIRIAARELRDLDGAARRRRPARAAPCTGCAGWSPRTPAPARAATSPPTTTSATTSSPPSSTSG